MQLDHVDAVAYSLQLEEILGVPPLVRVRGKGPFDANWSKGPRENPELWRRKLQGWTGNLGIVTGEGLIGVDVDLYVNGAEDAWDALRERGFTSYTVTTITGGGGRHYFFGIPEGVVIPSHPLHGYPGIDIKGTGGCLVIPPSIHPDTGERYEWEFNWGPLDAPIVMLDKAQLDLLGGSEAVRTSERVLDDRDEQAIQILCDYFDGHSPRERAHTIEVTRPGKERGVSAEVGFFGPGVVKVWSSNWPGLNAEIYELRKLKKLVGIKPKRYNIPEAEHDVFIEAVRLYSRQQFWLWEDMIPAGQLALAVGAEKLGKTTACLWIAARASRGELPGDYDGKPVSVAFISAEDDAARVLRPRLEAAGADLKRIHLIDPLGPGFDFTALEALDVRLAIFDPMSVFLSLNSANEHGEITMRTALDPFSTLAQHHNMTVMAVRHPRKGASSDNVFDVVLGSRAWTAAARGVLFFTPDRENPDAAGGLIFARGNLSRNNPAHRYRLDSAFVDLDDGGTADVPLFHLTEGGVEITLEEALGPREQAQVRAEAKELLTETLAEGRMKAVDITALAGLAGISERTLKRAKKDLNIVTEREGFGASGAFFWRLPSIEGQKEDIGSQYPNHGPLWHAIPRETRRDLD